VDSDVFTISFTRSGTGCALPTGESPPGGFIAGPENRLAKVAVEALLDGGAGYSPVLFCGPSGTGKSHLAHGVAQARGGVLFTSGADFARELATAIDRGEEARFRDRYRSAEVLVVDGLTQLAGRPAALAELRQTLDDAELREACVVMTSRVPPDEIKGLPPALVNRLKGGLTVPLLPPGIAAKRAVLEHFAGDRGLAISPQALQLLAESSNLSVAECRGVLVELGVSGGTEIGIDQVRRHLAVLRGRRSANPKRVMSAVAKFYGLKSAALQGPSRRRQVVLARAVAMYLCRSNGSMSFEALGKHFGGRDHTTALHSCRSIERRLKHDYELRGAVETLQRSLSER
jgi:chromosomal replication initiator protein